MRHRSLATVGFLVRAERSVKAWRTWLLLVAPVELALPRDLRPCFSPHASKNIGGGLRLNRGGRPRSVNGYRLNKIGSTAGSKLKRFNGSFCFPRSSFLPAPPQSPSDPPPSRVLPQSVTKRFYSVARLGLIHGEQRLTVAEIAVKYQSVIFWYNI